MFCCLFNFLFKSNRLKNIITEQVGTKEKVIEGLNNFESNRAASVYFASGAGPRAKSKFGEPLEYLTSLSPPLFLSTLSQSIGVNNFSW